MKKFLLFIGLVLLSSALAWAQETFSYGDLTFRTTTSSTSVYVTGVSAQGASSTTIYIPSAVYYNGSNHRVWGISDNAFKNNTTVKSVIFNWGARIIGQSSFSGCTNLTEVHLSSSVARIDASAFAGCTSLQKVYYSSFDFPSLGCQATSWPSNSGMTLYISPLSVKTTSEWLAATGWDKFSNAVKSGDACDYNLQDGGQYAVGSTDADGVDVLRYLTLVGYKKPSRTPGYDPTEDGTVYKPESNISDGGIRFHFTTIGTGALKGKTALKTIDLSNAIFLTTINSQAFVGCSALTTLKIPKSVNSMALNFINGCTSLGAVTIDSENQTFANYGSYGDIYSKDLTSLVRVPEGRTGAMNYPPELITVWSGSHLNCTQITSASLPYGVKTIGTSAFYGCSNLKQIRIPSSVTSLSNNLVFYNISPQAYLYINLQNPPTITPSSYFGFTPSNINLCIPFGRENTYSAAGWTGFYAVNRDDVGQAYDFWPSGTSPSYTVTSTEPYTANDGTTYAGEAKTVAHGTALVGGTATTIDVPNYVNINGQDFAVTEIGGKSFYYKNATTAYTVTGCINVKTVNQEAFQNQPVTSYPFTHSLNRISNHAFDGAGLTGTVHIPYGVEYVLDNAFANGKYSRIVIPSSVLGLNLNFCHNTTTLKELVFNQRLRYNSQTWDLGSVPNDCYIRVPVGVVDHYKQNSLLSSRANYITAGAYDYAFNNNYTGRYFLSILTKSPVTYNGTTYAGKAKYVYHPYIQNTASSYSFDTGEEDRTVSGDYRQYLITEIGDSCFAGAQFSSSNLLPPALNRIGKYAFYNSNYANSNLTLPDGLTYIGKYAFDDSKLTGEIKIPASVTYVGDYAFHTSTLGSLYFPGNKPDTFGKNIWSWGSEKPVWVPNVYAYLYLNTINSSWDNASTHASALNVHITPDASSVPFSSVVPTYMSQSGIDAYIATAYDKSNPTHQLTLTKVEHVAAGTGMILTGLTPDQEYRIARGSDNAMTPATNYLVGTPSSYVWIEDQTVGYYWDGTDETPHFIRPTSNTVSYYGQAYLKLTSAQASGVDEVYTNLWPKPTTLRGDVNGDNTVDVNDVNIIINIILGKASTGEYAGNADVTGDDTVDVNDVNAVINIILGKA